jgi:hypothetical protein
VEHNSESDLRLINDEIIPLIQGSRRIQPIDSTELYVGFQEMACFQSLLSHLRPRCAVEIGTSTGSTFELIHRHSQSAISIDPNPDVKARLQGRFPDAEFITATSSQALSPLLARLKRDSVPLEFVFVDGNHTEDFVREDIQTLLKYQPVSKLVVVMHDSFNPGCRRGILGVDWNSNPWCHFVDVDFSPGVLHPDAAIRGQMWGGLGVAVFLPEKRSGNLTVRRTLQSMFDVVLQQSVHAAQGRNSVGGFWRRVFGGLR